MPPEPRPTAPAVIGVQSLLFHTPVESIERMLAALDNSSRIGLAEGLCTGFTVTLGDGSSTRVLDDDDVVRLQAAHPHLHEVKYHWFGWNVGTSRGHNAMAELIAEPTHLIFSNPDVVPEPRAIWRMLEVFDDPAVGFVEAKQLPIEHPKDFASGTGETGWATTAFAMTPKDLFLELGGFDEESFFMYCDDVDYSWRVREAGRSVIYQPAAVVFHDKYLSLDGAWQPTGAEVKYSARAALALAHKWSRPGLVKKILQGYEHPDALPAHQEAAAEFRRRQKRGLLPEPRDPEHQISMFKNSRYAEHRFPL
ncbi:MAG: glycosyltransferase [Nocardioides sp.]